MRSQEIAEAIRDAVSPEDWFALPLGVRFRIVKAVVSLVDDAVARVGDERA